MYQDYQVRFTFTKDEEGEGIDENTVLMLHLNNNVTDDGVGANCPHTVTNTSVTFSDTTKKFGSHSAYFDGDNSYLSLPDSDDWDICASNSDNWTVDLWVKHTDHVGTECYIGQIQWASWSWTILHTSGAGLRFIIGQQQQPGIIDTGYGGEITDSNWHHIALIKKANEYAIYKDGIQVNYTQDNDICNYTGSLYIGASLFNASFTLFDGYLDEIRIQHSNVFNASPNVGKTDTITVPIDEYVESPVPYILTYVDNVSDPEPQTKDTIIQGTRGDGSIRIKGGKKSQEITIRGKLIDEDGYKDITTLINEMRTKVTTDQAILTMEYWDTDTSQWIASWSHTVFRNSEIRFPQSLRTDSQEYEITFLVLAYN